MISLIYITLEKVRQLKYLLIILIPYTTSAQGLDGFGDGSLPTSGTDNPSTEGTENPEALINPLAFDNFVDFLSAILAVVMVIAVPIIIFFLVYAGFLYVTAQGNSEQVGKATRALTYAIIGGLIILGAEALSVIIQNIVGEFSSD